MINIKSLINLYIPYGDSAATIYKNAKPLFFNGTKNTKIFLHVLLKLHKMINKAWNHPTFPYSVLRTQFILSELSIQNRLLFAWIFIQNMLIF